MSKYTAEQVERVAKAARKDGWGNLPDMLDELARRLRQEEEEKKRDPAKNPMAGDRISFPDRPDFLWIAGTEDVGVGACNHKESWESHCHRPGATIIRRREVQ